MRLTPISFPVTPSLVYYTHPTVSFGASKWAIQQEQYLVSTRTQVLSRRSRILPELFGKIPCVPEGNTVMSLQMHAGYVKTTCLERLNSCSSVSVRQGENYLS